MEPKSFDLVVIGGGPAGSSGAVAATLFGKTVALVEKEIQVGGSGLNTGTIPSKALRESALILSGWANIRCRSCDSHDATSHRRAPGCFTGGARRH